MGLLFELKRTADVEALSWLQLYVMRRVGFLEVKAQYQVRIHLLLKLTMFIQL